MAIFDSLPYEIMFQLFDYTAPQDLVRTALINARLYNIAGPFLERHRQLHSKYAFIDSYQSLLEEKPKHIHFWRDMLRDVLTDPSVAYYVQRVRIGPCNFGWHDYSRDDGGQRSIPPSDLDIIKKALRTSAYIPSERVDEWYEEAELGNEDPILAILIPLLPNLCTLEVKQQSDRSMSCLHEVVTNAARAYALGKIRDDAFRSLKTLRFESLDRLHLSLEQVNPFMALPSTRLVRLNYIWAWDFRWHWGLPKSEVTDLNINSHVLSPLALSGLLNGIKALRRFSYVSEGEVGFEPREICSALLENSTDSLECLELGIKYQGRYIDKGNYTYFRKFPRLQTLSVNYELLDIDIGTNESLGDVLPPALESLSLKPDVRPDIAMMDQLDHMIRNKAKLLPLLQRLELQYPSYMSARSRVAFEEACSSAGVILSLMSLY